MQITSTLVRVKGEGLLRKGTKSRAGERTLPLPASTVVVQRRRFMTGARLDQPLFPDVNGGFRDSANVRRGLREARGKAALALDAALRDAFPDGQFRGKPWPKKKVSSREGC